MDGNFEQLEQSNLKKELNNNWKYKLCNKCGFVIPRRFFDSLNMLNCPICYCIDFKEIYTKQEKKDKQEESDNELESNSEMKNDLTDSNTMN